MLCVFFGSKNSKFQEHALSTPYRLVHRCLPFAEICILYPQDRSTTTFHSTQWAQHILLLHCILKEKRDKYGLRNIVLAYMSVRQHIVAKLNVRIRKNVLLLSNFSCHNTLLPPPAWRDSP